MNLGLFRITKGGSSKSNDIKELLLTMRTDDTLFLDHSDFYCHGERSKCTLAHYCFSLKEQGNGKWSIVHIRTGMAKVTCKQRINL